MRRVVALGAVVCAVAALSTPARLAHDSRRTPIATASIERLVAHPVVPLLHDEARSRRPNPSPDRHLGLLAVLTGAALCCAVTIRGSRRVRSCRVAPTRVRGRAPPGSLVI